MANQLSNDAKRISLYIEEIEEYNQTISQLEYQICDVPHSKDEIEDMQEEQKRLQNIVNTAVNDLSFDDQVEIEYDGKLTQVKRSGVLWLEHLGGYDLSKKQEWIEHQPSDLRNQRVAFLTGFQWDGMSNEMLDDTPIYVDNVSLLRLAGVQYRKLIHGEWLQPDPRETYLLEIAEEYYTACDVYDKYHCSGIYKGEPVPATPDEQRAINQNSIEVRRKITAGRGISEKEFHEAIKMYNRVRG